MNGVALDRDAIIALADHWVQRLPNAHYEPDDDPMHRLTSAAMHCLGKRDLHDQHPEWAFYYGAELVSRILFIVAEDPYGDPRARIASSIDGLRTEFFITAENERSERALSVARKLVEST